MVEGMAVVMNVMLSLMSVIEQGLEEWGGGGGLISV